ncbi:hypothetical protein JCM18237_22580 [Halorubrum luteum]
MKRTLLLVVVLGFVIGGGVLATGASDDLFQDVDDVEIDDDEIVLEAADSPEGDVYADTDGGELSVEIDDVNQLADTRVDNVFTAEYNGEEEARIHFEDVDDDVTIFQMDEFDGDDPDAVDEDNPVILSPDEDDPMEVTFGVNIVSEDVDSVEMEEITVVGQAVNPAFEVVDIESEDEQVTAGERVTVEAEIENPGSSFQRTVGLLVSDRDDLFDDRTVSLDTDGSTTQEFEYRTRSADAEAGEISIGVDAVDDVVEPDDDRAVTVQVEEPDAEFDVAIDALDPDDEVTAGDELTVTADIENVGAAGTDTVELLVDGDTVDDVDLELAADETATEDLTYVPTRGDADEGEIELRLESATDDSDEETIDVVEPNEFDIDITDVTEEPVAGEDELVVEAEVEDDGDEGGTARVWLEFDDSRVAFTTVDVPADDEETVEFTVDVDDRDVGERVVQAFTEDDDDDAEVTVLEPADLVITDVDPEDEILQSEDLEVDVTVENPSELAAEGETTVEAAAGDATASEDVTVAGGDDEAVTLTLEGPFDRGELPVTVTVDGEEATVPTTVLAPATFEVFVTDATDPVLDDETLEVDVDVVNVGDETGEETVELQLDDDTVDTETDVEVDGGDTEQITLELDVPGEGIDPGDVTLEVVGDDGDTDEVTVEVVEAPDEPLFRIEDPAIESTEIVQGADEIASGSDTLDIDATIRNVGDQTDEQDVELVVGGEVVAEETVELDGDDDQAVDFEVDADELPLGESTLELSTDDVTRDGGVFVREPIPATLLFDDPAEVIDIESIEDGEEVEVTVENVGELDGETTVELAYATSAGVPIIDVVTETVEVDADDTEEVALEADLEDDVLRAGSFPGELTVTIANDESDEADDEITGTGVDLEFGGLGDAVDDADEGDTVLVGADPPIDSTVTIADEGVTLEAATGLPIEPDVSTTAIEIDADDVTLDGLLLSATDADGATGVEVTDGTEGAAIRGVALVADEGNAWDPAIDDAGTDTLVRYAVIRGGAGGDGVVSTGDDLTIRDSDFRGAVHAIELTENGADAASNATVRNVDLISNERGLFSDAGTHLMEANNIERNDAAIETVGTPAEVFIDAPDNWWGSAAGPEVGVDILSNVEFTSVAAPFENAEFTIAEFEDEAFEIEEDETFEIEVTVENDGGTSGASDRQDIELLVDGNVEDSETIDELDPGETAEVDLSAQPSEIGAFDVRVRSDDDTSDPATLTVTEVEEEEEDPSPRGSALDQDFGAPDDPDEDVEETPEPETPTPEPETPTPEPDTPTPEPDTPTPEPDTPDEETPEEPAGFETPGFGVVVALIALLAAAFIAARRDR